MSRQIPRWRAVAWLSLCWHILVASGLPLPLAPPTVDAVQGVAHRVGKDRSRPFPCMDRACGCATAEQCFARCCCTSPAERLAWARAHRLDVDVLAALERRVAADTFDPTAADVCSDYRSLAADPAPRREPEDDDRDATGSGPRVVILRDALACGGIVTAWLACGVALPPPPRVPTPASDAPAGFLAVGDLVASSCSAAPAAPPPRVS